MLNSYTYNRVTYNTTGGITKVKTIWAKANIFGNVSWHINAAANIFGTTTQTVTSKASVKQFGVTQTVTAKANISMLVHIQALGRIKQLGVSQTAESKATLITKIQGQQPRFGALLLPFPHDSSITMVEHGADVDTLDYETTRDIRAQKYRYDLKWDVMKVTTYDALETLINQNEPLRFVYTKWPQSRNQVWVLGELGARELVAGTGSKYFWSKVSLTLTEVDPREE
jgi:hypothetical protein